MKKRKIIVLAGIVISAAVALAVLVLNKNKEQSSTQLENVSVLDLSKQNLTESINVSGTIAGKNISIKNTQSTKCTKINVSVGDYVNKGDTLFEFDSDRLNSEYSNLVEQFNAERSKAENQHLINERNLKSAEDDKTSILAQEQRKIDTAEKVKNDAWSKYEQLVQKYNELQDKVNSLNESLVTASPDEYDALNVKYANAVEECERAYSEMNELSNQLIEYENNVALAYESYENAQRNADDAIQNAQDAIDAEKYEVYSISQSDIDAAKEKVDNCKVKATVSGTITAINVCEGSIPDGETLITIVDTSNCFISANLSEANIYKVAEQMSVIIKTPATGDEEFEGKIEKISNVSNESAYSENEAISFPIEISILDKSKFDKVFIGMSVSVKIILNETHNVLAVPYDAVLTENKQKYLLIAEPYEDAYQVKKVLVETGIETNYYVEVSGNDLNEGMLIIKNPEDVAEGTLINIDEE